MPETQPAQTDDRRDIESLGGTQQDGPLGSLAFFWRQKWLTLAITAIALGLGYLYYAKARRVYKSSAQVLLIKKTADLPVEGGERQVNYESELSTHAILIRSPLIVERAVKEAQLGSLPSLKDNPSPAGAIIGGLSSRPAVEGGSRDPNVFAIEYEGPEAADCRRILDAVLASHQKFLAERYQDFSEETLQLIARAKDELHAQLTKKESEYREFRRQSPLLWHGEKGTTVHEMRLGEIAAACSKVIVENARNQARLEAVEAAVNRGSRRDALTLLLAGEQESNAVDGSESTRLKYAEMIFPALLEEQILLESCGSDHPRVRAVRAKLALMREHFGGGWETKGEDDAGQLLSLYCDALREEIQVGQQQLRRFDEVFQQEQIAAKAMANHLVDDETFRSEIARTQQLFDNVVKRLEEMNLIRDYGGISTEVISPPGIGGLVKPKLATALALSAVLGLMSGLGLGYLVELADRRFRTPEDVRHHLGLPLIGHIPVIHETGSRKRQSGATPSDGHIAPVLCAARRPKSCEAEAVRAVRTALYFSSRGQRHKVIQITSPDAGDGKTTLASNLAISIASSGKKTLLVDGDLRRATVHKMFGLENSVGLVELIGSGAKLADGVRQGPVENLWIISSGRQHGNPSELLTSPRFHELLDVLRQKYDFIIIDTPPMLPVTDPSVVAARVDGVLLVIRLTKHARDHASRAVEMLGALGATVLGVVVNGIGRAGGYGYRREYHYGYGYAYGYAHGNGKDGYYSETPEEPEPTVAETKA